jgi:hypothetical protein
MEHLYTISPLIPKNPLPEAEIKNIIYNKTQSFEGATCCEAAFPPPVSFVFNVTSLEKVVYITRGLREICKVIITF